MKKILHIFSEINYSGAELMWYSAIDILKEKGYELELVSTGDTKGNFAYAFEDKGVKVHHVSIMKALPFLSEMNKLMREIKPNVLHIHPENKHLYFYYTIFGKLNNSIVIRTVHSICKSRISLYGKLMRLFSKIMGCKFVSISKSVQDNEIDFYSNKTFLINNWADDNKFIPVNQIEKVEIRQKLGLQTDKTLLVSIGNCLEVKNHKLILEALNILDDKFLYIHIGKEDEKRTELEYAKSLGIEQKVLFLGAKNNVNEYLQASDIFIMPSLYEGVGNAAIESIMTGTKTILTDVHGLNAFKEFAPLVKYTQNDKKSLAETIENFENINNEDIKSIRKKVVEKYGVKQAVEKYLELYEN